MTSIVDEKQDKYQNQATVCNTILTIVIGI